MPDETEETDAIEDAGKAGAGGPPGSAPEKNPDRRFQVVVTVVFLAFYFGMVGAMFLVEASDTWNMKKGENSLTGELQILFGVLTAGVAQILSFWFSGNSRKG